MDDIFSRGRAVAASAYEDRLAVFPTSVAAGSNVVDKVFTRRHLSVTHL